MGTEGYCYRWAICLELDQHHENGIREWKGKKQELKRWSIVGWIVTFQAATVVILPEYTSFPLALLVSDTFDIGLKNVSTFQTVSVQ